MVKWKKDGDIMAFWQKKKASDALIKYLSLKQIKYKDDNNLLSFELHYPNNGYSIYPYFAFKDDLSVSIIVNIRRIINDITIKDYDKINRFNNKSKFFQAKINDEKVVVLEYNAYLEYDLLFEKIDDILSSLLALENELDQL